MHVPQILNWCLSGLVLAIWLAPALLATGFGLAALVRAIRPSRAAGANLALEHPRSA